MKFRSLMCALTSQSCLRTLLCLGALGLLVACEAPAEKVVPADDTSATVDTAVDAADAGADTADTGAGEVTEDTAPDGADTAPDTAPDTVTDTGEPPATCDEQLGLLPSTDCGCGGQLICRDQAAPPVCVGALPENACGGCGGIAVEIGAGCGFCGDGVWTCDAANPDVPNCVGETPQNSCGGCTALPGMEGESCSADGFFLCVTEEELACVGPGQNACGGFSALGEALGGPCGECGAGRFVCDGTDTVRCEEAAEPRNACGGCGTLPNRLGDACGDCYGTWQCDAENSDGLVCSQSRNVCGSCGSPGAGALGEACTGGRLVCGVDGQLSCESNDRNLCGGTMALSAEPGTGCGSCGGVNICAGLERIVCIGSSPVNACGGCGFLPGFPGTFCGVDHTWECNANGTMACAQTSSSVVVNNTVGGTTAVAQGQVTVPAGAVPDPIRITIRVRNGIMIPGYELTSPVLEFGPAGTEFATPIEVQIISDDAPASDMVWSNRPTEGGGYSEVLGATVDGDALVGDVSHFSIGFTGIPLAATERCDDLFDNDSDGLTDCDDLDCAAAANCALPEFEFDCSNSLDDDSDGLTDCDDSDCAFGIGCREPLVEICEDGVDNDIDGMTDCADADCASYPGCIVLLPEVCGDGLDNDDNGLTDCADSACADDAACIAADAGSDVEPDAAIDTGTITDTGVTAEICTDGLDNDGDRLVDCADPDCASVATCVETNCTDGLDNDGDTLVDCADRDCASVATCVETNCTDNVDNNGDGFVDCADADCGSNAACFEAACGDYADNDGDLLTDCNDPDCVGTAACQEICDDGIDNDGDALVDCFDVACRGSAACPQQLCAGLGTYANAAGNGVYYLGFGTPMTSCAPDEGCSLISPPTEVAVAGALVPTFEGVCAPRLADGDACTSDPADGYCAGSVYGGAGCIGGRCRTESTYCDAGDAVGYRTAFLGGTRAYCVPTAQVVATGASCDDLAGTLCGRADDCCLSRTDLSETISDGICFRRVSSPEQCPAGARFQRESITAGQRSGLCLPVVGDGAACGVAQLCDETLGLVCGSGGTCRAAIQAEACASPGPLTANTSAEGPDFFAVDRLDGLTAADESLNCSGTVGPEKVYFYTATASAELRVQAGSLDGNGPMISWYARRSTCGDIFAEAACGDASLQASSGTLQVASGETIYIIVDSESRWAGGDGAAAEFFVAITEAPIAQVGESCLAAACAAGLNCTLTKVCAVPFCGDGQVGAGEQCDDGNIATGDGCAACTLESYTEAEPNDAIGSANSVGGAHRVYGSSTYNTDFYCVPVGPFGGKVSFRPVRFGGLCDLSHETFGTRSCEAEPGVVAVDGSLYCFSVYSSSGAYAFDVVAYPNQQLAEHAACGITRVTGAACGNIGGNAAVCRETDPRLHRGTCEVTTCGDGYLDKTSGEACDDGNLTASDGCSAACLLEDYAEVEPNNGTLTARNIDGYRKITGTISGATDYDYFKVTLTRRSHLEFDAEATAFPYGSNGLGIQLLSASAAVLLTSTIDNAYTRSGARGGYEAGGAGYFFKEQALAFLEPGTYTIRVSAAATYTGAYRLFIREFATSVVTSGSECEPSDYKPCLDGLACSVLSRTCQPQSCGNGDVTVGEQCDDGNTAGGDGCSTACLVEPIAAASIPTGTAPSATIEGGVVYPFTGGSAARAIAISGPWEWESGYTRYLRLHLDAASRIRAFNVTAPWGQFRIWKLDAPSSYSTAGSQVVGVQRTNVAYPSWFAALTLGSVTDVTCDGTTGDGICTSPGTGNDCVDCGARYGSTPRSDYGFDARLAPGDYLVEINIWDVRYPSWIFLGESPSEARQFR